MKVLKSIVKELAELKKEGDYWDFKREPHHNNADLLHDILCLSNSLHKGDRYLIIGIDEKNDYKIHDLKQESIKDRKTQANLMDFLSSKKFAGDYEPEIKLETLCYEDKSEIDVIIIKDTLYKPYFLSDDYRDCKETIRAGVVYNKKRDKNVPKNNVANLYQIEKMWKQRFGLADRPAERMQNLLLKPNEWEKGFDYGRDTYHKTFPEFSIEFGEGKNSNHILGYLFNDDENTFISLAKFKFHTTTLFDLVYLNLDGGKTMLPRPDIKRFFNSGSFYYFTNNSIKSKFLYFLYEDYIILDYINHSVPIPIFESEDDMEIFLCNLEPDDNIDFRNYLTKEKLEEAEKCRDVSLKLTIQVYESLKKRG
jgi:hypothetical protein